MLGREAAQSLRRLADILERFKSVPLIKRDVLDENCQLGAAAMLMFLRDLFTIANKDQFTREEILVLLNDLQNDRDIFIVDLVALMGDE
ncbi:MAG: hypothetical protein QUT30_03125 [Acidobacteriota bacterium]|nr:hypothetical protein [Acidobacteriota bacterium]